MTWRFIRTYLAMISAIALLCGALLTTDIGRIRPIAGTTMLTDAILCSDNTCKAAMPLELPYFGTIGNDAQLRSIPFALTFDIVKRPVALQALYLPKYADHVSVMLNHHVLRVIDITDRQWAEPELIDVPPALLVEGRNTLTIVIAGRQTEGMELYPVFLGPHEILQPMFDTRQAFGPMFARFTLVGTIVLGFMYLLVWTNHRQDPRYLWLGLSSATGSIVLLHFGYGVLWGGYKIWTGVLHLSIAYYTLFNMKFIHKNLKLPELWFERTLSIALGIATVTLVFIPVDYLQSWGLVVNIITMIMASSALTVFWVHRRRILRLDFYVIFGCLLVSSTLGMHEIILRNNPQLGWSFHMFHFVPLCMSLVSLWVIVSQLVRSLRSYETLTNSLNDTLTQKSHELEQSFARIAEVERRKAVDVERNRIMLDLHDGIGGQLVSTLAYMESTGNTDATLKDALKAALQDLALVLDSLDSYDSLTTLLGMLRTRLEPLLGDHGLQFNWQIMDDPIVPNAGPSSNLHLARIVQEAITNVIKHAQASTITVYTDAKTIVIADNGIGIDPEIVEHGDRTGHGLESMRQRATSMLADFAIEGSNTGTSITLRFADDTGH